MSILIKGLSLPTDGSIEIQVFAEGKAIKSGYTVRVNGMDYYQPTIGETPTVDAIELPPHGRLIDADKITLTDIDLALCEDYKSLLSLYINKVESAQTIIEAEDG